MTKYVEYAKVEMVNDKAVRMNALSYCYGNVLVFKKKDFKGKEVHVGDTYKVIYHYWDEGIKLDSLETAVVIPVRNKVAEQVVRSNA